MSPAQAHTEAHEHVMLCFEILTVVQAAIEGSVISMGLEHRNGLATVLQRAVDEARAARDCFPHIPRPKDPL